MSRRSFPGGKLDETDSTPLAAALRETREEVGIHSNQIEILGRLAPPENSLSGMRVWPYVGFVYPPETRFDKESDTHNSNAHNAAPLPSLPLSSLTLSRQEVAHVFHLPLAAAVSPTRLHSYLFRGARPYHAVSVADLIAGPGAVHSDQGPGDQAEVRWIVDPEQRDEVGGGREGRLEVWGLTGWYLNVFLRTLGVYE
ncbi:hypothetical protein BD310DRAFT_935243 [Dichomitus squalens]|uniref:Nudix hydrolase domain-containing protein n=1 Tax=Dichomitus squalens TaxID=114155 RepID=A0A4Q9PKP3_9APHY|nr:hypothetical protein BD310DRAFT_935243 [Dichomitus squalens]